MKRNRIILFFIVVMFFLIGVVITKNTLAQDYQQQMDVACIASDVPSWRDCLQQVKEDKNDFIKITHMIECSSKQDCAVDLSELKRTILIYGVSNTDTGFKRIGDFSYSLITMDGSQNISIGGFLIDDTSDEGQCLNSSACPPIIYIKNVAKITINALQTKGAKNSAILVEAGNGIVISKSFFDGSAYHAVEIKQSKNVVVQNNRFRNSGSNALIFSSLGDNRISSNTFEHNHKKPSFSSCVSGTICTAAQLVIASGSGKLTIDRNTIFRGYIEALGAFGMNSSGIEIAGSDVESISLTCNTIIENTGNGIVIPSRTATTKQILMKQNKIFNNGLNTNFVVTSEDKIENNCFNSSCHVEGC